MDSSGLSLNKSTFEERQRNLSYIRVLYLLLSAELILALIWSSFCLNYWEELGKEIVNWWEFGLAAAILCVLLIIITLFLKITQKFPINWVIYILFTLSFAHLCAFLSCWDKSRLFYFALWLMTAITFALFIYAFCSNYYMETIPTILIVFGSAAAVLVAFIVFTQMSVFLLILVFVPVSIFGVYLAYDTRRSVRNSLFDTEEEDPVSGAVRIWIETVLVFCRLGELIGNMFHKSKATVGY